MKTIFLTIEGDRLRAGWRIAAWLVLFAAMTAVIMVSVRTLLGGLRGGSTLQFVLLGISATASVYIARRFLDKRTFRSLGLDCNWQAVADTLIGVIIAALIMAGMFFTLLGLGAIEYHGLTWWNESLTEYDGFGSIGLIALAGVVLQLTTVAWWEELVFRGYLLRNMIAGMGLALSVIVSSLFFGFGHVFNPEASIVSSLMITLITPQLIYAYIRSGHQLWLPIGLHLGWNFFQASIFGFASSGQKSPSLISQSPVGPDWISGGAFGAETSILILPYTALSFGLIYLWTRNR